MSWGDFKSAASEVADWLWGTVQGGFNEKQTIGQIITDAVVSMFPIAGEVTAARDVIAASLRLAQYPDKREEAVEWLGLVLPLLAVVPVFGGALKGIGKLLLRAGRNIDEDRKILEACIWLLNRVGRGDAVKYLRELDFSRYAGRIQSAATDAMQRIEAGIDYVRQRFGAAIPAAVHSHLAGIKAQLQTVRRLIDKMVPLALKEINAKLKYIQRLMYEGEWHAIPGAGKALTRETEARLVHDAVLGKEVWKLEGQKWPANTWRDYRPEKGWPDLTGKTSTINLPKGGRLVEYWAIAAFSGPIKAVELPPGTVIYRIITPSSDPAGLWWTAVDPKTINGWYWRVKFAVLQSWSTNGKYVKYVVKDKPLHVWEGKVASQIDQERNLRGGAPNPGFGQYLEGGETQLYLDLTHPSNAHALADVRKLPLLDTEWIDHMNVNLPERGATAQKLTRDSIEPKSLPSANLAAAANAAAHGVRAASSDSHGH